MTAALRSDTPAELVVPSYGTGRGVRVGIIDSGWDRSLNDARVWPGIGLVDSCNELALRWSCDDHDRNGHGTAAADLLLQVAPDCTVVPIRVFGRRLETSPHVLVAAVGWAVEHRLPVVNLSLGTVRDDALVPLYRVCEHARLAGTVIVAAGANGADGWSYPAVFDGVIGVRGADVPAPYDIVYTPGVALECGARAVRQLARGRGGTVRAYTGTSFAAPVVAGHVARLRQLNRDANVDAVRTLLGAPRRA